MRAHPRFGKLEGPREIRRARAPGTRWRPCGPRADAPEMTAAPSEADKCEPQIGDSPPDERHFKRAPMWARDRGAGLSLAGLDSCSSSGKIGESLFSLLIGQMAVHLSQVYSL